MAVWPASINLDGVLDSYEERPERNVAEFTPEVGPPMTRRRMSLSSDLIRFDSVLTTDEWADLLDFYRFECKEGALSFTRTHPRPPYSSTQNFKWVAEPSMRMISTTHVRATLSLRALP